MRASASCASPTRQPSWPRPRSSSRRCCRCWRADGQRSGAAFTETRGLHRLDRALPLLDTAVADGLYSARCHPLGRGSAWGISVSAFHFGPRGELLNASVLSDDPAVNLQLGLGVELAVLPPYLYALWSIKPAAEGASDAAAEAP